MTSNNKNNNKPGLAGWRARNRFYIQACALVLGLLAPFGLYVALQDNLAPLSILFFSLLGVCMLLTFWAG